MVIVRSRLAGVLAVAALGALLGCGGGGGGGDGSPRMPNVVGQSEAAARQTFATLGLDVGLVHVSGTAGGAEPTVVTQSRAAGERLSSDTVVELVLSTAAAGSPPPIRVWQDYPGRNTIVHDQFRSTVSIESLYELSAAVTSISGHEWGVTYQQSLPRPIFYADVDVTAVPAGPQLLTTRVTDVRGNFSDVKVTIVHDVPATLRVTSPADDSVALSTLPIDVTCVDDFPGCEVQLFGPEGVVLAQGAGGIVANLDLSR